MRHMNCIQEKLILTQYYEKTGEELFTAKKKKKRYRIQTSKCSYLSK